MTPLFSLIHATARIPDGWKHAYLTWMLRAADSSRIEYLLCVDCEEWEYQPESSLRRYNLTTVYNHGPKNPITAYNLGASKSRGEILIVVADDFFPPNDWDRGLLELFGPSTFVIYGRPWVVQVSTEEEADRLGLITHPILTRAYYEQKGGTIFDPAYESVYADDDFTAQAKKDGVIVDALHLKFSHPPASQRNKDAVGQRINSTEMYLKGGDLFEKKWGVPNPWRQI